MNAIARLVPVLCLAFLMAGSAAAFTVSAPVLDKQSYSPGEIGKLSVQVTTDSDELGHEVEVCITTSSDYVSGGCSGRFDLEAGEKWTFITPFTISEYATLPSTLSLEVETSSLLPTLLGEARFARQTNRVFVAVDNATLAIAQEALQEASNAYAPANEEREQAFLALEDARAAYAYSNEQATEAPFFLLESSFDKLQTSAQFLHDTETLLARAQGYLINAKSALNNDTYRYTVHWAQKAQAVALEAHELAILAREDAASAKQDAQQALIYPADSTPPTGLVTGTQRAGVMGGLFMLGLFLFYLGYIEYRRWHW